MTNEIISAIDAALKAEFGAGCSVYPEEARQNLAEPCFFIQCMEPSCRVFPGKRYLRRSRFCIQYFPKDKRRERLECSETAERLFGCLEWLEIKGDPVMGTGMSYGITGGVLSFFVSYDMFVYKKSGPEPAMGGLEADYSVKGQG